MAVAGPFYKGATILTSYYAAARIEKEKNMTEEQRREHLAHLVEYVSMPVDEAQDLVREDDEWVVEPEVRFYVPEDEIVQEWEYAVGQLSHLADAACGGGLFGSVVVGICLADVEERAKGALRRARKRARQAREGE